MSTSAKIAPREGERITNRVWLMSVLVTVYAFNFVDRTIVNILQQPIKEELVLQDWQLGLLGGTTFAIFYVFLGIYVARLAEKKNRVTIMTVCILLWSLFTALVAGVTTFIQLLLLRIGVAVGEAGATPTSHSLISDHFSPAKRPGALAIFASGNTIGNILGALIGGFIGGTFGWRVAFIVAGVPGILLAAITFFTLKDPRHRGQLWHAPKSVHTGEEEDVPSFADAARLMLRKPTFRQLAMGAGVMLFGSYGVIHFMTPHLMRTFGMSLRDASLLGGVGLGIMLGIGTISGGFIAQKLAVRDRRWVVWTIATAMTLAVPLTLATFLTENLVVAAPFFLLLMGCLGAFQGPLFATAHSLVQPRMRATASALMLLVITLVGLGLGPLAVGIGSDLMAAARFEGSDFKTVCASGTALDAACQQASATGLRLTLASCAVIFGWASIHFWLAGRTIREDVTD